MSTAGRRRIVDDLNRKTIDVLNKILQTQDIKHSELSLRTGIPRSTLSKVLAGTSAMDLAQLSVIAEAINKHAFEILALAEESLVNETGFDTDSDNSNEESNVIAFPGRPREVPGSDLTALPEMA